MIILIKQFRGMLSCLALVLIGFLGSPSAALTPVELSKIADQSIGRVVTELADGYGLGTGFVISQVPGSRDVFFATNHHVIAGAKQIIVFFGVGDEVKSFSGRVATSSRGHDMAVIRLTIPKNESFSPPPLVIANRKIEKGEAVFALGFPGVSDDQVTDRFSRDGLETTLSDGLVSRVTNGPWKTEGNQNGPSLELIQHTAAINHGNSGGPLLDSCARVLGVNTAGSASENVFLSSSSNSLSNFLKDAGIPFLAQPAACNPDAPALAPRPSAPASPSAPTDIGGSGLPVWGMVVIALLGVGGLAGLAAVLTHKSGNSDRVSIAGSGHGAGKVVLRMTAILADGSGQTFALTQKMLSSGAVLGRTGTSDLAIETPKVSRKHAKIYQDGRKLMLVDLGSTNGTKVDGTPMKPHSPVQINSKSVVELGNVRLRLST